MKKISLTKKIKIGNTFIGGNSKITIQSMLNMPTDDINGNIIQAKKLQNAGCDILRVAIPNKNAIPLISALKSNIDIPIVADIHFDYRLVLLSIKAGIDKIRINPGNIGDKYRIKEIALECKKNHIPIRIGINGGSIDKTILEQYSKSMPEAMVASALTNIHLLQKYEFDDIVVSLKCSNVNDTVKACRLFSEQSNYPLHLGITEAGTKKLGVIKSSIGLGSLLLDNIGNTIRVSLTDDPVEEIYVAKNILKCIGKYQHGVEIISCPTCGRTKINIIDLSNKIEKATENINKNIKIAIMGCAVNGPGEAKDADIGIAGGEHCALLFKKGNIIRKIPEENILTELINEINKL